MRLFVDDLQVGKCTRVERKETRPASLVKAREASQREQHFRALVVSSISHTSTEPGDCVAREN
jgi:hypothetical protein